MKIRFLTFLLLEGEKTTGEISRSLGISPAIVSREMGILAGKGLVKRVPQRPRYWEPNRSSSFVEDLDRFILLVKNSSEILRLFDRFAVIRIGAAVFQAKRPVFRSDLERATGLSPATLAKWLSLLMSLKFLNGTRQKPQALVSLSGEKPRVFFSLCNHLARFGDPPPEPRPSPGRFIADLRKDPTVMILLQYGSTVRKTSDAHSDIDLFVVTRDPLTRGKILSRPVPKMIDLNVLSKKGFLDLLKTQPDFVHTIASGLVHKGKMFLQELLR